MNLLDYSRDQIKQFVKDGICPVQALRDYDVLKQIATGDRITNVALDHNLTRQSVYDIKNKYQPKV
jgi:hypothetical protein